MAPAHRAVLDPSSADSSKPDRRSAILRAAIELFAEQGYHGTTLTAIAERAGVSRRLFFHYFTSKDDILFQVDERYLAELEASVAGQPTTLSDLDAAAAALKSLGVTRYETASGERSRVVQLRRAAASSPALRGRQYEVHMAHQAAIARGLAARRGLSQPDDPALSAAALAQTIVHLAVDKYVENPKADPARLVDEQFAVARSVLG